MKAVAATREDTVVIELPENCSDIQVADRNTNCLFSQQLPKNEHPNIQRHSIASSNYQENNSSTDTIPETCNIEQPSAYPPITLLKPGAHNQASDREYSYQPQSIPVHNRQVRLEDTVADGNFDFIETPLHLHSSQRLHSSNSSPHRRYLSTRGGRENKRRVKTDSDEFSFTNSMEDQGFENQQSSKRSSSTPAISSVSIHSDAQAPTTLSRGHSSISSSSMNSSLLDTPPSLIHNSESFGNSIQSDTYSYREVTYIPFEASSPAKKRKIRRVSPHPGLVYAKRMKHSDLSQLAGPTETFVIPTSSLESEYEDSYIPPRVHIPAGLPSSPPRSTSPFHKHHYGSHRDSEGLNGTTAMLQHQLSFAERDDHMELNSRLTDNNHRQFSSKAHSLPFDLNQKSLEQGSTSTSEPYNSDAAPSVIFEQFQLNSAWTPHWSGNVPSNLSGCQSDSEDDRDMDSDQPYTDPMDIDEIYYRSINSLLTKTSHQDSPKVSKSVNILSDKLSHMKTDSIESLPPRHFPSKTNLFNSFSSPIKKGPSFRVGLSRLARVESLHGYLRDRNS